MRAALLHEANKPLVIQEVQIGKPERNEVLIRTAASGLCHSDLHFVDGIYPFKPPAVLGHESAGIVAHRSTSPAQVRTLSNSGPSGLSR